MFIDGSLDKLNIVLVNISFSNGLGMLNYLTNDHLTFSLLTNRNRMFRIINVYNPKQYGIILSGQHCRQVQSNYLEIPNQVCTSKDQGPRILLGYIFYPVGMPVRSSNGI